MEHIDKGRDFTLNLVFGTKNMGVVLGKSANPHDSVQRSRGLVSMATAKLGEPHGKIPVGLEALVKHLYVTRTVHWLDRKLSILGFEGEHP